MDNYVMMQYFEWYMPGGGQLWNQLAKDVDHLKSMGVSGVWIPPCTKGTSVFDVGYGSYDLYDLGEFDQKGTIPTKYGTKAELQAAIKALHDKGLKIYADVVLNHKAGADETEKFQVVKVDPENREEEISEPFEIEGWTRFTFPGRKGKYSDFTWGYEHFTGTDFDQKTGKSAIYKILGENKDFSPGVDTEFGNYDYLMFTDVDYHHPDVIRETIDWGEWFINELNLDGMRLDAIKHINENFIAEFVREMRARTKKDLYVVGEYWKADLGTLKAYLRDTDYHLALFDVSLHFRMRDAAEHGRDFDLRTIFNETLVEDHPLNVVTFVDNHDSQPGQALESWIADWFKPIAYALILLRQDGYPCIFYGDYYGIGGENPIPGKKDLIDPLLQARKHYAYGEQIDTFDHANVIAWQRMGDEEHPGSGLAVVISNGDEGYKDLSFGSERAGTVWVDITGNREEEITLDEEGQAAFTVNGGQVSVWVQKVD